MRTPVSFAVLFGSLLSACAGANTVAMPPGDHATDVSETPTGNVGATCRCAPERALDDGDDEASCVAVTCDEGLVCAYPCGIPGCDNTCMTQADADIKRP